MGIFLHIRFWENINNSEKIWADEISSFEMPKNIQNLSVPKKILYLDEITKIFYWHTIYFLRISLDFSK